MNSFIFRFLLIFSTRSVCYFSCWFFCFSVFSLKYCKQSSKWRTKFFGKVKINTPKWMRKKREYWISAMTHWIFCLGKSSSKLNLGEPNVCCKWRTRSSVGCDVIRCSTFAISKREKNHFYVLHLISRTREEQKYHK